MRPLVIDSMPPTHIARADLDWTDIQGQVSINISSARLFEKDEDIAEVARPFLGVLRIIDQDARSYYGGEPNLIHHFEGFSDGFMPQSLLSVYARRLRMDYGNGTNRAGAVHLDIDRMGLTYLSASHDPTLHQLGRFFTVGAKTSLQATLTSLLLALQSPRSAMFQALPEEIVRIDPLEGAHASPRRVLIPYQHQAFFRDIVTVQE